MGREKARLLEIEETWERMAAAKEWRCSICSCVIIDGEQVVYSSTGMCGYHAHMMAKDD